MSDAAENRSLINLALDLVEIDPTAPENQDYIVERMGLLGDKVESYVFINAFAESQMEMLGRQVEHLQNEIKKYEKLQKSLKERAVNALKTLGTTKLKSDNGYYLQIKHSEKVRVYDENLLPDWAVKTTVTKTPKLIEIKAHIDAGNQVPGATIRADEYGYISKPRGLKK